MKKIFIAVIAILIIFTIFKAVANNNKNRVKQSSAIEIPNPKKQIDFHNYPVSKDVYRTEKKEQLSANKKSGDTKQESKYYIGKSIPDWVFKNTISKDLYYDLINSKYNFVFASFADCPIGKQNKAMVDHAINRSKAISFRNRVELMPNGTRIEGVCHKFDKNGRCYFKEDEVNEGTCKCAVYFLMENCRDKFCIINPTAKRVVFVELNEDKLTSQLQDLNKNW